MPKKMTTEDFILKARKVHKDKYDYSKVNYTNSKAKVIVVCPDHGEFLQAPNSHLNGRSCPSCSNYSPMDTGKFIAKAKKVHGDKYDYSRVDYTGTNDEVSIVCKVHGEFKQKPTYHLNTSGCPKCMVNGDVTTDEFISRSVEFHGDRYDYSLSEYKNSSTNVTVICKVHGEFEQNPRSHMAGVGCAKCAGVSRSSTAEFKIKAADIHQGKYSYAKVKYINNRTPVKIICKMHGEFEQQPSSHLAGAGCPECANNFKLSTDSFIKKSKQQHGDKYLYHDVDYSNCNEKILINCRKHGQFTKRPSEHLAGSGCPECAGVKKLTTEEFITNAKRVHGDLYDYSESEYVDAKTKLTIICRKHGDFETRPADHVHLKSGCPKCAHHISKAEYKLKEAIESHDFEVVQSDRKILNGLELDLVIPEKKLAIEFNGIKWHSDAYKADRYYHANKTKLANRAGYRLIHIWEDDFNENPEREIKFILNSLGVDQRKSAYARKTKIHEITTSEASKFLNQYHIQGSVGSSVKLGTFLGGELVAVTLFTKRKYGYELVRYAASIRVVGGLGKVVKHFHREYDQPIHSFCDLSRHDGRSYEAAGFVESGVLAPDYKYAVGGKREHKFGFRLNSIKTKFPEVFSPDKTEREMMEEAGIPRVWDCGKTRYIFE